MSLASLISAADARQRETEQQTAQKTEENPLVIESATSRGTFGDSQYLLKTNQGDFYYVPLDYVNRGYATDQYQYYNPEFLDKDFLASGKRVNLDPTVLEGKTIASTFENPNSGYLFKADEFEKRIPSWAYYHEFGSDPKKQRIGGISEVPASGSNSPEGGLKYVLENNAENQLSFINPNATATTRTYTIEYSGIFGSRVAEALARGAQAIGKVPFLTELTAAIPVIGPAVYGTIKGAQAGAAGKGPLEAAAETGLSLAAASLVKDAIGGGKGVFGGDVEAQPGGFYGEMPTTPGVDYSLIGGANFPPAAEGMGGGTGITPGAAGEGLQLPTAPNIGAMGGGQGLLVPVDGGTVGALGLTPTGATPVLGDPKSFINDPNVLGQPVIAQGSLSPLSSLQNVLRGANLARQLLTPQQAQTPNLLGQAAQAASQMQGAVDYSSLLGLLSQQAGGTGLLGTRFQPQPINLASLLG